MSARVPRTDREREVWNAAISAAARVCREVDQASVGHGHQFGRPKCINGLVRNPYAHRLAEISLGAQRCLGGIQVLRR